LFSCKINLFLQFTKNH